MSEEIKFTSPENQPAVSHLFFSKLFQFFFLLTLFAGAVLAQGKGSSVMLYSYGEKGTDAEAMAHLVRDQIGIGLEQYPCIDQMDDASLAALLGWERWKQILGQEPNDEMLKDAAGAVGARYIILITTTNMPNGTTYTTVKILDTATNQTAASRETGQVSANDGVAAADALAKQILQELAGIFKGQCEPHWTGTITYTYKYETKETKTVSNKGGADEINITANISDYAALENTIEAVLQPMSQGTEGSKTMSRVVHKYIYRYEHIVNSTSSVRCRPPGANSYYKQTSGSSREINDERGENTATLPVWIYLNEKTGKYTISVNYPALTTKRNEERSGISNACNPKQFSETSAGEGSPQSEAYTQSGSFTADGQTDPKNPGVLSGKKVTGELEYGQSTMTWNLRLVTPKKNR